MQTDFSLTVMARGYIEALFFVEPSQRQRTRRVSVSPFTDTTIWKSLPQTMDIKLQPAKPVLLKAAQSSDPQRRRRAEEMLRQLPESRKEAP